MAGKKKAVRNNLCKDCLDKPNEKENLLEPRICPRCSHKCEITAKLCSQCGFPLSQKAAEEAPQRRKNADQIMNLATKYPEFMEMLEKIFKKEVIK